MSPKLPVVSGEELVRALEKFGHQVFRQKVSQVRLPHSSKPQRLPVTVPLHSEIAAGTPRRILREAAVSVEALISAL